MKLIYGAGCLLLLCLASAPFALSDDGPTMTSDILAVKAKYTDALMANEAVVSVGVGLNEAGQAAIIIGLIQADKQSSATLPKTLDGFPVVLKVMGKVEIRE